MTNMNESRMKLKETIGLLLLLFCSLSMIAQERTIRGVVKDNWGDPIIGANVMLKGTSNGSATDMNGN